MINLVAVIPLGGVAIKLLRNYAQQKRLGYDPVFHRDMLPEIENVEVWDGSDALTADAVERVRVLRDATFHHVPAEDSADEITR